MARACAPGIPSPLLFSVGARNLARHRRRTGANVLSVAISVGIAVFFAGYYRGSYDELLYSTVIDYQTGHAQIQSAGLDEADPDSFVKPRGLMTGWTGFRASLLGLPGIVEAAPRLVMAGFAGDGRDRFPVLVSGVLPEAELKVGVVERSIIAGSDLGQSGSAIVGEAFARLLGLGPGSSCVVQTWTTLGSPNIQSFTISGVFRTSFAPLDRSSVYVRLADAQELADCPGAINKIFVKCSTTPAAAERFPAIAASAAAAGFDAKPWTHYAASLIEHASREGYFYYIFLAILFFLSVSTVATTMHVNVFERRREIGALRALGWRRAEVSRLFLLESVAVGAVGSILGLLLGGAASFALAAFPIDLRSMSGTVDIPFFEIKSSPALVDFVVPAIAGVLAAAIAGLLPARKAARTDIVRALSSH
jgi:ABC-type lipoprotein release transport system permease subunit